MNKHGLVCSLVRSVPLWTGRSAAEEKTQVYCSVHAIIRIFLSTQKNQKDSRPIILLAFASRGVAQGQWVYPCMDVHISECVFTCDLWSSLICMCVHGHVPHVWRGTVDQNKALTVAGLLLAQRSSQEPGLSITEYAQQLAVYYFIKYKFVWMLFK